MLTEISAVPAAKTLLVLVGPTGVGKTALSLDIAERFNATILNADSRQIYRDIPIGTAAPTAEEQARVPHAFVGMLSLTDYYSAARFEEEALRHLEREFSERDVVLLTGGSMLYVDAVCRGIDEIPTIDAETRALMLRRLEAEGLPALAAELQRLDPDYFAKCDPQNTKRVVHALEICHMTGRTYSSFRLGNVKKRPFRIVKIGLERERAELFERISQRTDEMISSGWLDEAQRVLPFRACNSLNTVGYKELFAFLDGMTTLEFALEKIKRNTRVYAKKQITWFKHDASTHWFHPSEREAIFSFISDALKSSGPSDT